ncbi:MAG: hypothetical protein ACRDIB_16875, partial [Ardenticatenaceae bacterium]
MSVVLRPPFHSSFTIHLTRRASESLALFLLFFSLAMVGWNGTLHSSDGLALYAVSDALARYGRFDIESIRWINLQQGTFGPDGLLYSRKGLATSVLALPLTWLGLTLPKIGPLHTALLLTPLLHALTALYLYHTVRRAVPASGRRRAMLIALLWALGSMALPYIKTFHNEPAVALALIAALFHLLIFRDTGSITAAAAVGGWLGLSLLARAANAVVFPLYGFALLAYTHTPHPTRSGQPQGIVPIPSTPLPSPLSTRLWSRVTGRLFSRPVWAPTMAFAAPILLAGILYLWYNWYRFGNPLDSGYIAGEDFSAIWWQGILGLTVSPGRGLLWYTPWLPFALVGARRLWRRDPVIPLLVLGSALLYVLLYGKWYLWSGGFAWGPRFLVPLLPLLAFLVAPLLIRPGRSGRSGKSLLWATALLGVLINLVGVLWDFDPHQQALIASGLPLFAPETFFQLRFAQIPGVLRLGLQSPGAIDLAWSVGGYIDWPVLILTLLLVMTGVLVGGRVWRGQKPQGRLLAGTVVLLITLWLLLARLHAIE